VQPEHPSRPWIADASAPSLSQFWGWEFCFLECSATTAQSEKLIVILSTKSLLITLSTALPNGSVM
jgi:hypothetical protein